MDVEPRSYTLALTQKRDIAYQTMEFRFKKPEGFVYRAGQSMRMKIPGIDDERTLSIVTAPHEPDLAFAFRVRGSEFKKRLKRFEVGDTLVASGPNGKFGLHGDDKQPALYIAGGIGITIYMSILSHMEHNNFKHPITLLYSNRNQEDISYLPELESIARKLPNVKIVPVLSKEKLEGWKGDLGRIDGKMVRKYAGDLQNTFFYVAAAPQMVESMEDLLRELGVPEEHRHMKRFRGY